MTPAHRALPHFILLVGVLAALVPTRTHAAVSSIDDQGTPITLSVPARRIVSLAPHATELLFAAGAGDRLVAVDTSSDYPAAVQTLPRIGGLNPDLEALAALQPDLVIAWASSSSPWLLERLRSMHIAVYVSEIRRLDDIPTEIERFGRLTGTEVTAQGFARNWRTQLTALERAAAGREIVPVFYQILDSGLLTITDRHLIGDVIARCGGRNIFAAGRGLTLQPEMESVLYADPAAIVASGFETLWESWRQRWRARSYLRAVAADNLFYIPPELLHRSGPRVLEGARRVCAALAQVRAKP